MVSVEVHDIEIKAIQTSVPRVFTSSSGSGILGKFGVRLAYLPTVLPVMAVDMQVLLTCLNCSFTDSISL